MTHKWTGTEYTRVFWTKFVITAAANSGQTAAMSNIWKPTTDPRNLPVANAEKSSRLKNDSPATFGSLVESSLVVTILFRDVHSKTIPCPICGELFQRDKNVAAHLGRIIIIIYLFRLFMLLIIKQYMPMDMKESTAVPIALQSSFVIVTWNDISKISTPIPQASKILR